MKTYFKKETRMCLFFVLV